MPVRQKVKKDSRLDLESAYNESLYVGKILELTDHPERLQDAWLIYQANVPNQSTTCGDYWCAVCPDHRPTDFVNLVNELLDEDEVVVMCPVCRKPEWRDDCQTDAEDVPVCEPCRSRVNGCGRCDFWLASGGGITFVDGYRYCEPCLDDTCSYCDDCEDYYPNEYASDHEHNSSCGCSPQELRFQILANSHGTLQQDERLLVELPEGFVSEEAIRAVTSMLWNEQFRGAVYDDPENAPPYHKIVNTVDAMDRTWQTKSGNFTRRLSKALYKDLGVKLAPGILSRVGSVIKEHSGTTNKWHVEVTRDLNQPAEAFYNAGSCWWGSESGSLCALKNWGGLAMRSYATKDQRREYPSGRAWIQPLNKDMKPTRDVFGAHAYIVYNGYGDLEGYTAARLLAYLTSRSYRKIGLSIYHQFVNGSTGFLVADQATCDATSDLIIGQHMNSHEAVAA